MAEPAPGLLTETKPDELHPAFMLGALLLLGIFLVTRALVGPAYYSAESAFAGATAALLAVFTVLAAWRARPRVALPETLLAAAALWLGVYLLGFLRTPNMGVAVPFAGDALLYMLLLFCGVLLGAQEPRLIPLACRAVVATAVVEAFLGLWQYFIDFPRMLRDIGSGLEKLPEDLQGTQGLQRLNGCNVFGTFVNPNLLAAFLLLGLFLTAGLLVACGAGERRLSVRRIFGVVLLAILGAALWYTGSKGAIVAGLAGAWFFGLRRLSLHRPRATRWLWRVTWGGLALLVLVLALGVANVYDSSLLGASMQVRLEYWKAAAAMFARNPLAGTGLGGFAENYSFFKTALGTEVKEAHNDYLQLLAEMGVVALLSYALLWWLLLRARGAASENAGQDAQPAAPAAPSSALRQGTWVVLAGGVLGFAFLGLAFQSCNAGCIGALFHGRIDGDIVTGALYALALPVIFAGVLLGLRVPHAESAASPLETGSGIVHGIQAGIGAVLVHQAVDFDLRAQVLLAAMFLLGGMLYGRRLKSRADAAAPRGLPKSLLAVPLLLLLFIPGGLWLPVTAGIARGNAEILDANAEELRKDPSQRADFVRMRRAALEAREDAVGEAPFNGDFWIELAAEYERLPERANPATRESIRSCLEAAEVRRPLSHVPKALLGSYFMRPDVALYERARAAFEAAAARYPLAPGPVLWEGDAWLLDGKPVRAAECYLRAFRIDLRIYDANVRLSSAFTDPRAGVFSRHGREGDVLLAVRRLLAGKEAPGEMAPKEFHRALLLRQMLALAWAIRDAESAKDLPDSRFLPRLRKELAVTAEQFAKQPAPLEERAHAAFLRMHAYHLAPPEEVSSGKRADVEACTLQFESIRAGTPGTPVLLFPVAKPAR